MGSEETKKLDWFEFSIALLLGLGAIGGAWSAFQGDLWGGASTEGYGEAAMQTTRAATVLNLGFTQLVRDLSLDVDAKRLIAEGVMSRDETDRTRSFMLASYLYAQQMSDEAYRALELPPVYRTAEGRDAVDHMPIEALEASLVRDLGGDPGYMEEMLRDGTAGFRQAEQRFALAQAANEEGDKFGFAAVLYTIALFLGGIALVFKSRAKWLFATMGACVLLTAIAYMLSLPLSGPSQPAVPPQVASPDTPVVHLDGGQGGG